MASSGRRLGLAPSRGRPPTLPSAGLVRRWTWAREHTLLYHLVALLIGLLAVYLITSHVGQFREDQIANVAYLTCAVAGLSLLVGLNGQISLGHGALMAVGAYTAALLTLKLGWGLVPSLLAATAVSAAVGVVVGVAAARLRGPYLAGATLALAVGLPSLADWKVASGFLGASNGLSFNQPQPPGFLSSLNLQEYSAWFSCLAALLVLFFLANLVRSRVGRNFRAVRDDEVAAQLAGLNVARVQTSAFVVSSACAGLGGGLLALDAGLASPGAFPLALSLSLLSGVILGGLGSLAGAVYGSLVLVFLPSWANNFGASHNLGSNVQSNIPIAIYGAVLIVVMLVFPYGLQGGLLRMVGLARRTVRRRARG